jgi:DNA-binding MarR family transcriptional regulator
MAPTAETALPKKRANMPIAAPVPHTSIWERPGFLVRRLHQIHVAMFLNALSEENVTPIQYGLLSILLDQPGLDQLSVAKELGIDRANVGDILKRLEDRKLLTRVIDPSDKRRKICLLTRDGVTFVNKYRGHMQQTQEQLLEPLSADERKTFMTLLRRLVGENNDIGRAPLTPPAGGFLD